ncbi:hypothetical protein X797_003000 [Metarhizium robertsii]|uniref:Secreted protein n=1 Tax=Metarhizium robertsii TaxID=568076 RepID=A0A0A1V0V0_9HYPO|nr:hypothetical protein X797_003000 [Metarhizium robertsii]
MLANACGLAGLAGLAGWAYALVPSTCQLMPTQASMHNFATANHLLRLRTHFCYTQYGTQPHKAQKGVSRWGSGGQSQTVNDGRKEEWGRADCGCPGCCYLGRRPVYPSASSASRLHVRKPDSKLHVGPSPPPCTTVSGPAGLIEQQGQPSIMQTTDASAAQQTGPRVNLDRPIQLVNWPARQLARPRKPPKWKHEWKTALGPGCGSPKSASDWGWGRLRTPVIVRSMSLL